jgi:hypothetical protein
LPISIWGYAEQWAFRVREGPLPVNLGGAFFKLLPQVGLACKESRPALEVQLAKLQDGVAEIAASTSSRART